ncbi:MAG: phenylalanine--tRNA ligase subunit beta [Polyangiales bacterium]
MRASYKWLRELCAFEETPEQVASQLTSLGLEVEGQEIFGALPNVVVAEVRAKRPHPSREKLTIVNVFDGAAELEVVCGAPNVPAPGRKVLFARPGSNLPGGVAIGERSLGGVKSSGMLCGESELNIGPDADGIVVLAEDDRTPAGTEVADALDLADTVFEIGLTPNRPDCLGHVGIARELSVALGAPLKLPVATPPRAVRRGSGEIAAPMRAVPLFEASASRSRADEPPASTSTGAPIALVPVSVADPKRCPRYAAAPIENVKVGPSPFWLRYRLHVLGLRPINSVVDATNLVLVEYGYPTHAFDLALVRGARIEVRTAKAGEKIKTLDGIERALSEDDLLICDAERALAVGGVMGGEDSGVRDGTERVLVECAYFDPRSVRRTSRRLGLHTDASHRYERGVDPRAVPAVLARVVSLICQLTGGEPVSDGYEVCGASFTPREIPLRSERLESLLGAQIPFARAAEILTGLGCEVASGEGALRVFAPTFRPDLTREEDLIEEVARVWGYDRIPVEVPSVRPVEAASAPVAGFVRRLKTRAAAVGLTEAVNLSLTSPKQIAATRAPMPTVKVANPLSEERSVMRSSLLPGLAANLLRAQRHQVAAVSMFELARVFTPTDGALPIERHELAIVLWGGRDAWLGDASTFDFYDGKGRLEALLPPLLGAAVETVADDTLETDAPYLHPRRAARVRVAGQPVGVLGELHPDVLDVLELTGPVVYASLDVAGLLAAGRVDAPPQVQALPRFPASARDLAIAVEESIEAGDVARALREAGGPLVERVELFDLYRGGQVEAGKKSLAFRITYRDPEATLTDARVDAAHAGLVEQTLRRFGASVRA